MVGWAAYVRHACDQRLHAINAALVGYAQKNGGCFPIAKDMPALLEELTPYLQGKEVLFSAQIDVCPLGASRNPNPVHYRWDSTFAGMRLQDVRSHCYLPEKVPVLCPYHDIGHSHAGVVFERHFFDVGQSGDFTQPYPKDCD